MRTHFLLRRALKHRRVERVERIDDELLAWLGESYLLGEQR